MSGSTGGTTTAMRTPTSTYRLQITAEFDLFAATRVLPYLHDLGVDWVYLSPLLEAEPGSPHGYDVVSHDRVDPARGGADGLAALSAEARRLGMGVLVDIVPNHVGVATPYLNAWWWDLLAHGPRVAHAAAFDVDWEAGAGRLLVPVVGDDDVLEDGRIGNLSVVDARAALPRPPFPARASVDGRAESRPRRGPRPPALPSWSAGARPTHGLNYRRFFAITTLAGIRVEDPTVLDASHVEIRRWLDEGLVDGLRVDHPDGLRDPASYLDDLAELSGGAYVLVEKILQPGEALEREWATAGTTGYDVLGLVDRVLTDPAGEEPLTALETRLPVGRTTGTTSCTAPSAPSPTGILGAEVRRTCE